VRESLAFVVSVCVRRLARITHTLSRTHTFSRPLTHASFSHTNTHTHSQNHTLHTHLPITPPPHTQVNPDKLQDIPTFVYEFKRRGTLGYKWRNLGTAKPTMGRELPTDCRLATALAMRVMQADGSIFKVAEEDTANAATLQPTAPHSVFSSFFPSLTKKNPPLLIKTKSPPPGPSRISPGRFQVEFTQEEYENLGLVHFGLREGDFIQAGAFYLAPMGGLLSSNQVCVCVCVFVCVFVRES